MGANHNPDANREILHDEFHHLITLTNIVAAYNSNGVPQLGSNNHSVGQNEEDTLYQQVTMPAVLTAITLILVTWNQILAVTHTTPKNNESASNRKGIPMMNGFLCVKNPHHEDENIPSIAKHCRLIAQGHPLEVDVTVEDDKWWKLCIENQG